MSARSRTHKMNKAGFTLLPLPKDVAMIGMRGGQGLGGPQQGDEIDLYINDPDGKEKGGQWVSGYKALSGVEKGEAGGAYDGEDVMFVGESNKNTNDSYGPEDVVTGDEWPVDCLRLSRGTKPAFADAQSSDGADGGNEKAAANGNTDTGPAGIRPKTQPDDGSGAAKFSTADFFSPHNVLNEMRDYHGRWTSGGGQTGPGHATPAGKEIQAVQEPPTPKQAGAAEAFILDKGGITPEQIRQNVRDIWNAMGPEKQQAGKQWYYEAHDFSTEMAQHYDCPEEISALVLASLSPQVAWGEAANSDKQFLIYNQGLAYQVMELAFTRADETIDVTKEMAEKLNAPTYVDEKGKVKPNGNRVDIESYNGKDPGHRQGDSYIGPHRFRDLPADVLVQLVKPHGIMVDRATAALLLARGASPDMVVNPKTGATVLNGPKTRSFYNNIADPYNSEDATIDVHMLGVLSGIVNSTLNPDLLTGTPRYRAFAQAIQDVAHEVGVKPHELQAATWSYWSRELHKVKGEKDLIHAKKDAADLAGQKEQITWLPHTAAYTA